MLLKLEAGLVATLSDSQFIRSIAEMGAETFTPFVRVRIEAGLDFLGPDTMRLAAEGEIPPPPPTASLSDDASYIDEVRDRSFSRSSLAASEETLERHVLDIAEQDTPPRSRAASPGTGYNRPGNRRASPDNAQAPVIDEPSGLGVVELSTEPDASPPRTTSHSPGLPA